MPTLNMKYMAREIPLVFFVFMISNAWGTNEIVVQVAANKPIEVVSEDIFLSDDNQTIQSGQIFFNFNFCVW